MKKPKGYRQIVVDGAIWFWKVGRRSVIARSESRQNFCSHKDKVPSQKMVITQEMVDNADDDFYYRFQHRVGNELRTYSPENIATWIRAKTEEHKWRKARGLACNG